MIAIRVIFLATILGLTTCQFPYNKFRPSPIDGNTGSFGKIGIIGGTGGSGGLGITHYTPTDYIINLKPQPYQQQPQIFRPPQQPNFGGFGFQQPISKPLFTPAEIPYPAETQGQIDNYNKALLEEAQAQKNQYYGYPAGPAPSGFSDYSGNNNFGSAGTNGYYPPADYNNKGYVSVKFGGPQSLQYQYTV